jgi:hypothetical protein
MADDTRGWIVQPNPSREREVERTDDEGNTVTVTEFGGEEWAYRRPGDHVMVFSGVSADEDPPSQSAAEHLEASGFEAPVPDSTAAANELSEQQVAQGEQVQQSNPENQPAA